MSQLLLRCSLSISYVFLKYFLDALQVFVPRILRYSLVGISCVLLHITLCLYIICVYICLGMQLQIWGHHLGTLGMQLQYFAFSHSSDMSAVFLRYSSCILQVYLRQYLDVFLVFIRYSCGISQVLLRLSQCSGIPQVAPTFASSIPRVA